MNIFTALKELILHSYLIEENLILYFCSGHTSCTAVIYFSFILTSRYGVYLDLEIAFAEPL